LSLALKAHAGQVDRFGAPYILHPLRVMHRVKSPEAMIAAILHDVIEDSPMTLQELAEYGFGPDIIFAVDCLSKRDNELYEDYIKRVKLSGLAVEVKLADLEDNMDIRRAEKITEELEDNLKKYLKAWQELKKIKNT